MPLRARISERLGHSGPTVSQTIGRMERDGLVVVEGDRHLELTVEGRTRAMHVMRKHRLAERLLADVIGLDWAYVHDEACRWEHVMSEQVERRLLELLDHPTESPYGNPIPGTRRARRQAGRPLPRGRRQHRRSRGRPERGRSTGTIRRLGEPVQFEPELLQQLKAAGVMPGAEASISAAGVVRPGAGRRSRRGARAAERGRRAHLRRGLTVPLAGSSATAWECPQSGSAG